MPLFRCNSRLGDNIIRATPMERIPMFTSCGTKTRSFRKSQKVTTKRSPVTITLSQRKPVASRNGGHEPSGSLGGLGRFNHVDASSRPWSATVVPPFAGDLIALDSGLLSEERLEAVVAW